MERIKACLSIFFFALAFMAVACTAQELDGRSAEQFPAETATAGPGSRVETDEDANTPTVAPEHAPEDNGETEPTANTPHEHPAAGRGGETRPTPDTPSRRPLPERVPFPEEVMITGEAPEELMDAIVNDLVERASADREAIEVLRSEAVVWRDGSLGCPEPGMMYTQALVDGYWVVLSYGGKKYDYRVGRGGYFRLCEGQFKLRADPFREGDGTAPNQ